MKPHNANWIFQLLIEECDAREDQIGYCVRAMGEDCTEYRFQGNLGFGGKFYNSGGKWYVTCYLEDLTPERELIIKTVNDFLESYKIMQDLMDELDDKII